MNSLNNYLTKASVLLITLLSPIHGVMATVGFLIVADLVTGMIAAKKRGEKINSAAMRRTVSKMVVYQIAVISGFLLETQLLHELLPVTKVVAGVIGMVEFKSILENGNTILGVNIFKEVIKRLGSKNDQPRS